MLKLTKRTVDTTEPQAAEFFLWDKGTHLDFVILPSRGLQANH